MIENFRLKGKASFLLGGQWGSEGKGAAAASIAAQLARRGEAFDVVTTNAGAQAGHTSTHGGKERVVFHLPTAGLVMADFRKRPILTYLNAGSIIDPDGLCRELEENVNDINRDRFFIHPNAAVITQEDRDAEGHGDSAQTKIASTRKGVGSALSRKVLRSATLAEDHPVLKKYCRHIDLNEYLRSGMSVLVEVPQGVGLSLNGPFYPHCTSRDCTVQQAMSDAGIHPSYYGASMLVLRTFPIRVGNIENNSSGGCYEDQHETSWEALGQKPEITTVTKRVRRVFTFSTLQAQEAMALTRPDIVYLTFCDYFHNVDQVRQIATQIEASAKVLGMPRPQILYQYGPTTDDLYDEPQGL